MPLRQAIRLYACHFILVYGPATIPPESVVSSRPFRPPPSTAHIRGPRSLCPAHATSQPLLVHYLRRAITSNSSIRSVKYQLRGPLATNYRHLPELVNTLPSLHSHVLNRDALVHSPRGLSLSSTIPRNTFTLEVAQISNPYSFFCNSFSLRTTLVALTRARVPSQYQHTPVSPHSTLLDSCRIASAQLRPF